MVARGQTACRTICMRAEDKVKSWFGKSPLPRPGTSGSWRISMRGKPRPPSASFSTPACRRPWAKSTKAPRSWTGWSRSRSAASASPLPPPPVSGVNTGSTSSIPRGTWISPSRSSAACACSTVPWQSFAPWAGWRLQSETVWRQADKYRVPRIAFINKCDRRGADPGRCVEQMRDRMNGHPVVTQIPMGLEDSFAGVIDLANMRAFEWVGDTTGAAFLDREIPASLVKAAKDARVAMIETLGEVDDEIFALYVDGAEISAARIRAALRRATIAGKAVPVLLGAAFKNKGVQPLLDAIMTTSRRRPTCRQWLATRPTGCPACAPASDDEPFSALAFKIMGDVVTGPLTSFGFTRGRSRRAPRYSTPPDPATSSSFYAPPAEVYACPSAENLKTFCPPLVMVSKFGVGVFNNFQLDIIGY